ncbi:hypothetical protein AY600_08805 [Phormidium willei BDU 130791]|nr:hypothetical protein AY600_08805 [Phormidium willei BDU 130791]
MQSFVRHTGILAPLLDSHIDTDQIVPARFLHRPRAAGYGAQLFHDLRHTAEGAAAPSFVLNNPVYQGASLLLAGANFGCGSSREQAVWALLDFGIRVVIAPSFGDIFYNNGFKNGLLPITVDASTHEAMAAAVAQRPGLAASVDLRAQRIGVEGAGAWRFEVDGYRKRALIEGKSEIEMTLDRLDEIEAFEAGDRRRRPWARLDGRHEGGAV